MSDPFEQLHAQFEQFQSKIQRLDEQFGNLEGMQAEIGNVEATVTSPDSNVTVTAGPGGSVTNIRFTPDALKQQPDSLASSVLSTLQQAVADAARQQAGLVDQHMGDLGFNATDQVLETQAQLFGTTTEELRSQMDQASPQPGRSEEDDRYEDYSQHSVLDSEPPSQPGRPQPPRNEAPASAGEEFLKNLFAGDEDYR